MQTDYELVFIIKNDTTNLYVNVKKETEELYERYIRLIHHKWFGLVKALNHHPSLENIKKDFYSDTYEYFTNAIEAIDLNEVRDDKWKFLGYYSWYLSNLCTKYRAEYIHRCDKEAAFFSPDANGALVVSPNVEAIQDIHSVEDEVMDALAGETIRYYLDEVWSEEERSIFLLKAKDATNEEITAKTGLSYFKIKKILAKMRDDLKEIY